MEQEKIGYIHPGINFVIKTEIYYGPIELLLELVYKNELNPLKIPVGFILDEFIQYIKFRNGKSLDASIDFLLFIALLIRLKIELFLPSKEEKEEELEVPIEVLIEEYEKIKEKTLFLEQKKNQQDSLFPRPDEIPSASEYEIYPDIGILFKIFNEIIEKREEKESLRLEIPRIEEKIEQILTKLKEKGEISFKEFLSCSKRKIEVIVSFLAILQLIKERKITFSQKAHFSDIVIYIKV